MESFDERQSSRISRLAELSGFYLVKLECLLIYVNVMGGDADIEVIKKELEGITEKGKAMFYHAIESPCVPFNRIEIEAINLLSNNIVDDTDNAL